MLSESLESLIGEIYAAALNREQWPRVLTQIGDALAGASGALGVHKATGGIVWEQTTWLAPEHTTLLKIPEAHPNEYPPLWLTIGEPIWAEVALSQAVYIYSVVYGTL